MSFPDERERWLSQARMVASLSPEDRIRASFVETELVERLMATSPVRDRQRALLIAEEAEERRCWQALAHRGG